MIPSSTRHSRRYKRERVRKRGGGMRANGAGDMVVGRYGKLHQPILFSEENKIAAIESREWHKRKYRQEKGFNGYKLFRIKSVIIW